MFLMIKPNEKLVNTIIDSIDWNEVYNPERMFSEEDISSVSESLPMDLTIRTGASKCVLIPETENFVIKLPFLYCSKEEDIIELQNAPFCGNDYCYAEYEYYSLAHEARLDSFFPETIQYCTYPYHIYLQEKCVSETNTPFLPISKKERELIESLHILNDFSYQWISACYHWYGKTGLYDLHSFLNKYKITDFHSDNYGYRISDMSPVLIDFSGFDY